MLRSLKLPNSTIGENPINFPVPKSGDRGTITVICGQNGVGKSFIIRALMELLDSKKAGKLAQASGWSVDHFGDEKVSAFRPQHPSSQMNAIGTLSLDQAKKVPRENDEELKLTLLIFWQLLRSVEGLTAEAQDIINTTDEELWLSSNEVRESILDKIPDDPSIGYWTKQDAGQIFIEFEKISESRVGLLRNVNTFSIGAAFSNGNTSNYQNFSDGQKAIFSIISSVLSLKPDIYLLDEIENYLHPKFMSEAMAFLKKHVKQTILSSHHPHLIFGNFVDSVFYIERVPPQHARYSHIFKHPLQQPAPERKIIKAKTDHEKLINAYGLFDIKDATLLATASHVSDAINFYTNDAVYQLFCCGASGVSPSPFPDRQSKTIAELVASYNPFPSSVLDWGAGIARVAQEIEKMGDAHPANTYEWVLYEPFAQDKEFISETQLDMNRFKFINDRRDIEYINVGVSLLTNVLHILPSDEWKNAINDCLLALYNSQNGIILITEIFPLLHPERNALPLPQDCLQQFFIELGFNVYGRNFSVSGANSYCLAAKPSCDRQIDDDDIENCLSNLYERLEGRYKSIYNSSPHIDKPSTRNEILNCTFGLATLSSIK